MPAVSAESISVWSAWNGVADATSKAAAVGIEPRRTKSAVSPSLMALSNVTRTVSPAVGTTIR